MKNLLFALLMVSSLYGCAQTDTDIYGTYDRGQHGDRQGFAEV